MTRNQAHAIQYLGLIVFGVLLYGYFTLKFALRRRR